MLERRTSQAKHKWRNEFNTLAKLVYPSEHFATDSAQKSAMCSIRISSFRLCYMENGEEWNGIVNGKVAME